jgi:hypothetical protein
MAIGIGRVGWRNYVSATPTNNPLWDNLKAYYTGDSTANDAKGTNNGTLTNGATYGTGKIGSAFSFDGINDYVELGDVMDLGLNSRSFSIWFKASSSTGTLFSKTIWGPGGGRFAATLSGNKLILFFNGGGGDHEIITTNTVNLNTWYNAVFIIDRNDKLKIYLNGILQDVSILQGQWSAGTNNLISYSSINYDNSFPFRIGSYNDSGQVQNLFSGLLDEFGIWDRALTAADVAELYNAGAGKQYVAPAYTTRTTAFATATGITDTIILNALNTFDTGLISNGLDTKMKALYPFVGGTANTHKFNFMDARDADAAFRLQFNGGWIHSSKGAAPNGTNAYANSYLIPSILSQNSNHISYYSQTNSQGGTDVGVMVANAPFERFELLLRYTDNKSYNTLMATTQLAVSVTDSRASWISSRTNSTQIAHFRNNTKIATTSQNSVSPSLFTTTMYVGARNNIGYGLGITYGNKETSMCTIGAGLSDTDASNLYTLTQAFQTSLSRQV